MINSKWIKYNKILIYISIFLVILDFLFQDWDIETWTTINEIFRNFWLLIFFINFIIITPIIIIIKIMKKEFLMLDNIWTPKDKINFKKWDLNYKELGLIFFLIFIHFFISLRFILPLFIIF